MSSYMNGLALLVYHRSAALFLHVFITIFPTFLPLYERCVFWDHLFKACVFILYFSYLQLFHPKQVLDIYLFTLDNESDVSHYEVHFTADQETWFQR